MITELVSLAYFKRSKALEPKTYNPLVSTVSGLVAKLPVPLATSHKSQALTRPA